MKHVLKVVALLLVVSACATSPPATRIVTLTPAIPAMLLDCAPAPDVPAGGTQADVARYIVALWLAGQDCRAHVAAIAQAVR